MPISMPELESLRGALCGLKTAVSWLCYFTSIVWCRGNGNKWLEWASQRCPGHSINAAYTYSLCGCSYPAKAVFSTTTSNPLHEQNKPYKLKAQHCSCNCISQHHYCWSGLTPLHTSGSYTSMPAEICCADITFNIWKAYL